MALPSSIAFSELVDASIVVVEQTHKNSSSGKNPAQGQLPEIVSRPSRKWWTDFFALLVSRSPSCRCWTLQLRKADVQRGLYQDADMLDCGVLAITLDPALRLLLPVLTLQTSGRKVCGLRMPY